MTINFMTDFLEDIKELIVKQFAIPAQNIDEDSHLEKDLGITDLEMEDFITTIENKYEIKIPQDKIPPFKKVSDIVSFLYENVDISS